MKRHPEVRAFWRASKDVWQGAGPVSFEARIRSRLRMTGITGQVSVMLTVCEFILVASLSLTEAVICGGCRGDGSAECTTLLV
jgi:hypothetical protein